jgi:hypothetical protein
VRAVVGVKAVERVAPAVVLSGYSLPSAPPQGRRSRKYSEILCILVKGEREAMVPLEVMVGLGALGEREVFRPLPRGVRGRAVKGVGGAMGVLAAVPVAVAVAWLSPSLATIWAMPIIILAMLTSNPRAQSAVHRVRVDLHRLAEMPMAPQALPERRV